MDDHERAPKARRDFEELADIEFLKELVRVLFNGAEDPMIIFDPGGTIAEVNRAACEMLGFAKEELRGMNNYSDQVSNPAAPEMNRICSLLHGGEGRAVATKLRGKGGETIPERILVRSLNEGTFPMLLCSASLDRRKPSGFSRRGKAPLRDPVTGLPTPAFFHEELHRVDSEVNLPISVIRADLDGMKLINSIYGKSTGDRLMRTAARALRKHSRNSDILIRWKEDEFLLLLPRTREEDAAFISERITEAFDSAKLRDIHVSPSISIGFAAKNHRWQKFENALLDAEEEMREEQASKDKKIRTRILSKLLRLLDENTPETKEHIDSMRRIARRLGELKGLSDEEMNYLDLAVRFHDVGKAPIPWSLLNKTGPITAEERTELHGHAEKGYAIAMAATPELTKVAPIILSHHERWDGTGYPKGLSGEEIPLLSRIIALADSFDVMTRGTPYRDAVTAGEALEEIRILSGKQFDPELASLLGENADSI